MSALYVTLGGKIKDFSFSAGVRSESWQVRSRSLEYGQNREDVPEFKKNFFALFPSLFLSYSLPKDNEIQINYTRRIRRPWGGQLNSFHNVSDPTSVSYGNPELEPQYSNSFELNYLKSWTYHMISFSAYVRTADNMINRIAYMDNNVMYSTFANVSKMANSGCEIIFKNSLFRSKLDLTTTVNLYNNHISGWSYDFPTESGNIAHLSNEKQNSFAWDAGVFLKTSCPGLIHSFVIAGASHGFAGVVATPSFVPAVPAAVPRTAPVALKRWTRVPSDTVWGSHGMPDVRAEAAACSRRRQTVLSHCSDRAHRKQHRRQASVKRHACSLPKK